MDSIKDWVFASFLMNHKKSYSTSLIGKCDLAINFIELYLLVRRVKRTDEFITWKWTVRFQGREADEPYKSNSTPIG